MSGLLDTLAALTGPPALRCRACGKAMETTESELCLAVPPVLEMIERCPACGAARRRWWVCEPMD